MDETKRKRRFLIEGAILLAFVLVALALFFALRPTGTGGVVVLSLDRRELGTYPLSEDRTLLVEGGKVTEIASFDPTGHENYNVVRIENGRVRVSDADCPTAGSTKCTHQGEKEKAGETITCLPHRLLVTVEGGE